MVEKMTFHIVFTEALIVLVYASVIVGAGPIAGLGSLRRAVTYDKISKYTTQVSPIHKQIR